MAPKNFDTDPDTGRGYRLAQDFSFTIAGETFELRHGLAIGAHALDAWWPVLKRMQATDEEREADPTLAEKVDDDEFLTVFRDAMLNLVMPGQEAQLERILDPTRDEPLMIRDAVDLILWAVPVVAGARPTGASSGSSSGSPAPNPEQAGTSSTGASTSQGAAASPDSASGSSAT